MIFDLRAGALVGVEVCCQGVVRPGRWFRGESVALRACCRSKFSSPVSKPRSLEDMLLELLKRRVKRSQQLMGPPAGCC